MTKLSDKYCSLQEVPKALIIDEPIHISEYLCDGELKKWCGDTTDVYSSIGLKSLDGTVSPVYLGSIPNADLHTAKVVLDSAIDAYNHGNGEWPTASVGFRIKCVQNFTNLMVSKKAEVVKMLMWEIGKTYSDSEKEFDRTVEYIKSTVDELKRMDNASSRFEIVEGTIAQIRRSPLGVVLCMGPYNYPLNETFTTLIPALIMGNVVILKPPRLGVLLFKFLLEAFKDAFPKGVINIIFGKGSLLAPYFMETGQINVLAFIGSSKVANELKKAHPKINRLRAVLGLDAKNVGIVLKDADLNVAVKEVIAGALSFNGQRCTALKLLFVDSSIVDKFNTLLCHEISNLKIGMPWSPGVFITPLPEMERISTMIEYIDDARTHGAVVLNDLGGSIKETLMVPAILYPVSDAMRVYREEQFGPVVPISKFDHIEEVLHYITESDFGQQVSIFGTCSDTIASLVDRLVNQVCRVNINCQCQRGPDVFPFVGRKDSAEGTLSVHDALRSFSIRTMVAAKLNDHSKSIIDDIITNKKSSFINTGFIL